MNSPNYHQSDDACKNFLTKNLPHYHIVHLNNNIKTPGRVNRNEEFPYLGITEYLKDKSVLDIGALDGVLSFNSERFGAKNILSIDVEDPKDYDWGYDGPTKPYQNIGEVKNKIFFELKEFFNSNVKRKKATVYDLNPNSDGVFDVVIFYGVLYHLRHPLLSLDKIRAVNSKVLIMETHTNNIDPMIPASVFYLDDVLDKADTNWTGASESCLVSWLFDAGYKNVWAEKSPRMRGRQRFIAFTGDKPDFEVNADHFKQCDGEYLRNVRSKVHELLDGKYILSK